MSLILNIETSTSVCSVALAEEGKVLFNKESFDGPSHATLLGVYMEESLCVLKDHGLKLDAVAVSSGPGSYTGLRIGVSMAKGLCFGYGIPLIGIPTLDIMAVTAINKNDSSNDYLYCAMLDARRMEVYSAIYDSESQVIRDTRAEIVTSELYMAYLEKTKICFFGNGAMKCEEIISSANAYFVNDISPLAKNMAILSEKAFGLGDFKDVAYFEPFYLKEFQATIAKNKVLNEALGKTL